MILESVKMSKTFLVPSILFTISMVPLYYPWFRVDEFEGIP